MKKTLGIILIAIQTYAQLNFKYINRVPVRVNIFRGR